MGHKPLTDRGVHPIGDEEVIGIDEHDRRNPAFGEDEHGGGIVLDQAVVRLERFGAGRLGIVPAHAVGGTAPGRSSSCEHRVNTRSGDDPLSAPQVHLQVAPHVGCAGDDVAGRHLTPAGLAGILQFLGDEDTEPVAVTGNETTGLRGLQGGVGVLHAQRIENMDPQVVLIGAARGRGHDLTEQLVTDIGVLVTALLPQTGELVAALVGAQSAGVGEQSSSGDPVTDLDVGQVGGDGRVEVDSAGLDQLHDRQGREGLGC